MLVLTLVAISIVALWTSAWTSGKRPFSDDAGVLDSRGAVAAVFGVTFLSLWYSWAAWNPIPAVHDEMSYVLQSQIFAMGRWSLPSPPMPLFWEQPHVLTEPVLASKYFPGHALAMTPGAIIGWVALMPLLLQSTTAALMFVLARRVASGGVALMTWLIWLISPIVLYYGASYFSESTTTVCWLGGWYALLRWKETSARKWLVLVAVCVAYCEVTRPLTGVAFAIPVGLVVLAGVVRRKCWRDFAWAFGGGALTMLILPLWSWRTTGDWRLTPLALYTRSYMPYDVPGFGLITTPPSHVITSNMAQWNGVYSAAHVNHLVSTLLPTLAVRAMYLSVSIFGSTRGILMVFMLIGLVTLKRETAFALCAGVFLLLTYLTFGTPPEWTLYYYESVPVYAYAAAAGIAWCASLAGRPFGAARTPDHAWRSPRWTRPLVAMSTVLALVGLIALQVNHRDHIGDRKFLARFNVLQSSIPEAKAILFVRHSPMHNPHIAFVKNTAHPATDHVWVVYDRGDVENAQLMSLAPERKAYLFDESRGLTNPYDPNGGGGPPRP